MVESFEHSVHDAVEKISSDLLNVVYMLDIKDKCESCNIFNKSTDIETVSNNCNSYGNCIATTLHPDIQQKIWDNLKIS
jgi:hypothetical protein